MKKTLAYLYRWTQKSTNKWYVGSRTEKFCHPDDGYICSSKTVEPMILENKDGWVREVLVIGDKNYIVELESSYLKLIDAKGDSMSFNMHNGDGKFINKGGKPLSQEHKLKLGESKKGRIAWNKGTPISDEQRAKMSASHQGKKRGPHSSESNILRSIALKGRTPWNKGLKKGTKVPNTTGESQ